MTPRHQVETTPERSALMKRVRRVGTAPERRVAIMLRTLGVGYRRNARGLPGSPDFSNRSRNWAIFVHGCFWHRHTACRRSQIPKANRAFWSDKLAANRKRDAAKILALRANGFRVLIIWECFDEASTIDRLRRLTTRATGA